MVKNRALKTAARKAKSAAGITYPRALATIMDGRDVGLVLGRSHNGSPIIWSCHPRPGVLRIRGGANAGKSTLLADLATQAAPYFDVYAYLGGSPTVPAGLKAHVNDSDGAWNLILHVRERMQSAFRQAAAYDQVTGPAHRSPDWLTFGLGKGFREILREDIKFLPAHRRPKPAMLLVDDFDSLCRNWHPDRFGSPFFGGPVAVLGELAKNGYRAGISLVMAGQTFVRYRYAAHGGGSNLLLGPATLAERESFLGSDVARIEVAAGAGLYEDGQEGVSEVFWGEQFPSSPWRL